MTDPIPMQELPPPPPASVREKSKEFSITNLPFRWDWFAGATVAFISYGIGAGIPMYIAVSWAPGIVCGLVGHEILNPKDESKFVAEPPPTLTMARRFE